MAKRATITYRFCWIPEERAACPIRKKKTRCLMPSRIDKLETPSHTELFKMGFICLVFDRRYLRETLRLMRVRDRGCKTLDVECSNEQSGPSCPAADISPSLKLVSLNTPQ